MNIIEAEDMIKGVPDQVLLQYAQNPPPNIPQFLAISEVQRRQDMRQRFQAQQQNPQPTIKDQVLQGGIASAGGPPPMGAMPPGAPMQQMPPGAPMQQMPPQMPQGAPAQQMPPPPMQQAAGGAPMRMSMGGIVPYRMQVGGTTPGSQDPYRFENLSAAQRRALSEIARSKSPQDQTMLSNPELFNLARPEKRATLFRTLDALPPPALEPAADPGAEMYSGIMSRIPDAFKAIRGLMPNTGGISSASLEKLRPAREQYFDPQQDTRRAELLSQLNTMGDTRKAEDIAAAERYLREAESPIQAAQEEARKSAIASTLMRLGAGVAAGNPAEGLASASEAVEQTLGRAREAASLERRAARQDYRTSEREAIRGQRSAADQAFMMQAQNITNDEAKQRELVRDQSQFAQWVFQQQLQAGKDRAAASSDALRLSIGISQSIEQTVKDAAREQGLDERQFASTYGSIFKEVLSQIKDADFGSDADGNEITPTTEQLLAAAREQTLMSLEAAGLYAPSSVVDVTTPDDMKSLSKGQRYRGPDGVVRIMP